MISFGRRGGALLLGIATGGLLIGGVAVAAPASVVPSSLQTVLGAGEPHPPPSTPPTTRPSWRAAAPVATALPTAAAVPADPASTVVSSPIPGTPPPAPTTTPEAVPVRAVAQESSAAPRPARRASSESPADQRAAARAAAPDAEAAGFAEDVIELTNEERHDAGCGDLQPDARLARSAQHHASDMAENGYFAHESQDGTRFDTRIREEGHPRPGGENIAKGQTSAEQVVREWMASPPHRRNIENCALSTIGVGYADSYWVQDFGR